MKPRKKILLIIISILSVVLLTIGITYAYWIITKTQTERNLITSGCLDITLTDKTDAITLQTQYPITNEKGMQLKPYTFTVSNNCNTSVDYEITLESIGDKTNSISASAIKTALNEEDPITLYGRINVDPTIEGAYESHVLGYGTLAGKSDTSEDDTATYDLRLWMDQNASNDEMNKTFNSKIGVSVGQHIVNKGTSLATLILNDANSNNYLYENTPDFSVATVDGEYGLYTMPDDDGTSYYFRGDVNNNYVKFGKYAETKVRGYYNNTTYASYREYATMTECQNASNYNVNCSYLFKKGEDIYWRVVRINGDGSIRVIYDGIDAYQNGTTHNIAVDNNGYSDYYLTYNGSTIKQNLENWYNNNILENYGTYIADTSYCNDMQVVDEVQYTQNYETISGNVYAGYNRLNNFEPKLACTRNEDTYTMLDGAGNGLSNSPIGLLSADEAMLAGANTKTANKTYYLYSGYDFWTMTPHRFSVYNWDSMWALQANGTLGSYNDVYSSYELATRPVINIKADTPFEGSGQLTDPYKLAVE